MSAQSAGCLAHLCVVVLAKSFQLPDIVLFHPPPGVCWVPVRGSFQILAHVVARATKDERLASRMHPQEARHVVHPGPHQHPARLLGTVAGHLPLREEPSGRGQRHPHKWKPKSRREETRNSSRGDRGPGYWPKSSTAGSDATLQYPEGRGLWQLQKLGKYWRKTREPRFQILEFKGWN